MSTLSRSPRGGRVLGIWVVAGVAVVLTALGGMALAAQDRYSVRVPKGLSFSEFRGYEGWQNVAVSQTGDKIEVILGNPAMIKAYRSGIPGNGKPFPDGAKMAKIHWIAKQSAEAPSPTTVPDTLHDIDFMVKDAKRYKDTGGWAWAEFDYDAASGTFKPLGEGTNCGFSCHTRVAAKDYVFTAYPKR